MGWAGTCCDKSSNRQVSTDIRTEPYPRSVGWPSAAKWTSCFGSYRDESSELLYPRWNFDTDHIYALGLSAARCRPWKPWALIGLAWVRGYDYQDYLPNVRHYAEVIRRTGIVSMLTHDRADFYIDALDRGRSRGQPRPRIHRSCAAPTSQNRRICACWYPAGPNR
jgi:hypothetical protein